MNYDYYKAEVDYRREQVMREFAPVRTRRRWRRAASRFPANRTR
jgi:hypothetical protein